MVKDYFKLITAQQAKVTHAWKHLSVLHLYIGARRCVIHQQCMVKDYLKLNEVLFVTDVTSKSSQIPPEKVSANNKEDVARIRQQDTQYSSTATFDPPFINARLFLSY